MRINVFLSAYFQYRDVASKRLGPGHYPDLAEHRRDEEKRLRLVFAKFEQLYGKAS